MFGKILSFAGPLVLAGAAVLAAPGSGQAQHHGGGGHGGGGHGGGFNHGSFHHGGFNHGSLHHGGFNHGSLHHGGFNHGSFHHGGFNHFHHGGFHHGGFHGGRWWYPRYYGYYGAWPYGYGYSPYYGSYDYYPYSYDAPSYAVPSGTYDSGYYGSYGGVTPSYPDSYSPATVQPDTSAHVTVSVPADAEIWFGGIKMPSTGSVREYQSPPLTPGIRFTYEVRARWNENGHEVTQLQQVEVTAGSGVIVRFPVQPAKVPTAPSH